MLSREIGELAVWVSEMDRPQPDISNVQAHNDVVEAALTEVVTPVPLRFGQWSADPEVFETVVREKAEWYHERLQAFSGALEFGIRVAAPDKPPLARLVRVPQAVTGMEYMNALRANTVAARAEKEEAERVRAAVAALMADLVREERSEEPRTQHGMVTIAHLVGRSHFEEYRIRAATLRDRFPDLRFLVSGPWVPYSFAL